MHTLAAEEDRASQNGGQGNGIWQPFALERSSAHQQGRRGQIDASDVLGRKRRGHVVETGRELPRQATAVRRELQMRDTRSIGSRGAVGDKVPVECGVGQWSVGSSLGE